MCFLAAHRVAAVRMPTLSGMEGEFPEKQIVRAIVSAAGGAMACAQFLLWLPIDSRGDEPLNSPERLADISLLLS